VLPVWQRAAMALSGVALLHQGIVTDLIGLGLLLLIFFIERQNRRRKLNAPAA